MGPGTDRKPPGSEPAPAPASVPFTAMLPAVRVAVVLSTFGLVFLGELPDKTMFSSLVLAARGRPGPVWVGTALAFAVHVALAVSIGQGLFHLLPRTGVDALAAALFFGGAVYSWLTRHPKEEEIDVPAVSAARLVATAAGVIFVAEWGDLTQIITADLALRYHSPLSVAVGALAALWLVAGLAVVLGPRLLRFLSPYAARVLGAAVFLVLAGVTAYQAA